ncbi:MAG: hypothetical protein Fur0022_05010 [Anaerolineales bacterium]
MEFNQNDLLPSEKLILSKPANAVISIDEYGLSKFAFDKLMWTVGMKGKEAIGGKLHLTNYRLTFISHAVNRLKGKFSIFLPTIRNVDDTSFLIKKQITVSSRTQKFDFVVWGIPELIAAIQTQSKNLSQQDKATLSNIAASNYKKCGEGLKIFTALEAVNVGMLTAEKIMKVVEIAQNPIEASSILNLLELFSGD